MNEAPNEKGTVLVVDDTVENLRYLSDLLAGQGYSVRAVKSAKEALVSVGEDLPDLVLLDVLLPDISGYDICSQWKAGGPMRDVPVLFLSALTELPDRVKGFASGGADFISKPFSPEEILARIGQHITLRRARCQLEKQTDELRRANAKLSSEIARRDAAERRVQRLTHLYCALSQCNQAIVRCSSEEELYREVCHSIVKHGGMKFVWIGIVPTGTSQIQPTCWDGEGAEYLDGLALSSDKNDPHGRGPTGTAVRENRSYWCQDFQNDPATAPWHERGRKFGWGASGSIPLVRIGQVVGCLTVYSGTPHAFDAETKRLLVELAGDISYALDGFNHERLRITMERKLAQISQAVEQSPASVVLVALDGSIEYVNQKFVEVTGYTQEEVVGRNPRLLKSGETTHEEYRSLWDTITGGGEWHGLFHNKKKNGDLYWEQAVISPIRDPGGKITHFLAVKEDITERKKMEEELVRAKIEAEEMNQRLVRETLLAQRLAIRTEGANIAKSEFMANITHELRTPMNAVIGGIDLLQCTGLNPVQQEYAKLASSGAQMMLGLVDNLLDFSKVEARERALAEEDFDLRAMVEGVAQMIEVKTKEKGLDLAWHVDEAVPELLRGDFSMLRQILIHLADNAAKFTEAGRVSISAGLEADKGISVQVRFVVSDTGVGVPADKQGAIFSAFTQADGSMTRKWGGVGLGLAIAKRFAELLGGTIGVESEEGCGSRFWFTARLEKRAAQKPGAPVPESLAHKELEPSRQRRFRILVAEDNYTNQFMTRSMLSQLGCDADAASDGREALAALAKERYDLVLMDCQMPVMDGFETVRALRKHGSRAVDPSVPVVALTAHSLKGDREMCLEAGMDDYIGKPVRAEDLARVIERWLGVRPAVASVPPQAAAAGREGEADGARFRALQPFDYEELLGRFQGDRDVVRDTMRCFLEDAERQIAEIEEACASGDCEGVWHLAHSLKGSAMNMSCGPMIAVVIGVYAAGQAGDTDNLRALLPKLKEEFDRVRAAMRAMCL